MELIYFVFIFFYFSEVFAERPLVTLSDGRQLEGVYQTTLGGRPVNAFQGIPYGKAERFSNPEPADPWTGVLDAGTPSPQCLQFSPLNVALGKDPVVGQEDCLFLDVVTPFLPSADRTELLPVVVVLPDGGFVSLGASTYGSEYLLDSDVIYVALNSRLGILGYLSTEDATIPGNWGLKDQVVALSWISDNIEKFGGDRNSVTLVGQSSGGACAHYHYFSQSSQGLFHRAIAMSGTAGNFWAQESQPRNKAQQLGTNLNCTDVEDSSALLDCLRSKTGDEIQAQTVYFRQKAHVPFGPVIEVENENAFITDSPLNMLKKRQAANLPLITSTVTETGEGLIYATGYLLDPKSYTALDTTWNDTAPVLLDYFESAEPELYDDISQQIRDRYFGDDSFTDSTFRTFLQMVGDRNFVANIAYTTLLQAHYNTAPVYHFQFNYTGSACLLTLIGATLDQLRPYGPCHGDDIAYMFNNTLVNTVNTDQDKEVSKAMVNMITSFATQKQPTFTPGVDFNWKHVSRRGLRTRTLNFLQINSESDFKMEFEQNRGDFSFWQSLPLNELPNKQ